MSLPLCVVLPGLDAGGSLLCCAFFLLRSPASTPQQLLLGQRFGDTGRGHRRMLEPHFWRVPSRESISGGMNWQREPLGNVHTLNKVVIALG